MVTTKQEAILDEITDKQPAKSAYFTEAEERAQVPFLHHQLLECDCNGREYTIEEHDITLRIPEGAVSKGEKIHFEIGVAMHGPFTFLENMRPVSPVVWLCILEEGVELKKPFQLILPHFLTELSRERLQFHQIQFAKANHKDLSLRDKQQMYKFNSCTSRTLLASSGCKSYGVIESTHCCFYCLEAKHTCEMVKEAGYCLAEIEQPNEDSICFTAMYYLDTCVRALKEQYPDEKIRYRPFKFKEAEELCIEVIPSHGEDNCVISFDCIPAKIRAADIDFQKDDMRKLKLKQETRVYPPRVNMTVRLKHPDTIFTLQIKFDGCSRDSHLNMEITFPLKSTSLSSSWQSRTECQSNNIHTMDAEPKLKDVFKKLYTCAHQWKSIGILLGMEHHILESIKIQEREVMDNCLSSMLSQWLKMSDYPPTWKRIVDAVQPVDASVAKNIEETAAY